MGKFEYSLIHPLVMVNWDRFPLKGSKEYRMLVTATGFLIGLVWIARDEYVNPKLTATPKAGAMSSSEIEDWNKQFGPTDRSKWAIPSEKNAEILKTINQSAAPVVVETTTKRATW